MYKNMYMPYIFIFFCQKWSYVNLTMSSGALLPSVEYPRPLRPLRVDIFKIESNVF